MTVLFNNKAITIKAGTELNQLDPNTLTVIGSKILDIDTIFYIDDLTSTVKVTPSGEIDGIMYNNVVGIEANLTPLNVVGYYGEIDGMKLIQCVLTTEEVPVEIPYSYLAHGAMTKINETGELVFELSPDAWGFDDEPTTQTIAEIEYPDGTVYEIEDTNARAKLDEKQDIITSANAGENIIITAGAVVPIVPLPEGYTQLEYIESTGSQYITLESTTYNQNDIVEIDYTYTSFAGSYPTIFGSGLSEIYANSNGDILVFRSIRVLEPTKYQINRKQTTIASFTASITSNQCISAYYTSGGATYFAMGKIYGFRHKRDNTVLKNLIPAREISTNNIGMYDIVNNTFINGSGIKQFIAGPIVADILKISADLSSKQDTLVSGINIKTLNNESLLGSGNIDISSAEWGNITGDLADQTDLSDSLQNVREVAEGKTKSYVVSYVDNPIFNTQDAEIKLDSTFTDVNGNIHDIEELKLGDNIFVQETDVPDRWCSQPSKGESTDKSVTLYKLETSKVDLTDYVKNTDYATKTKGGVIKVNPDRAIDVSNGDLIALTRTLTQYNSLANYSFISKGTIENIKEYLVTSIGDTKYQNKLTAGNNISIENDTISVTGDLGAEIIIRRWD